MSKLRTGILVLFRHGPIWAQRALVVVALILSACSKPAPPPIEQEPRPTTPLSLERQAPAPPSPVPSVAAGPQLSPSSASPVEASTEEVATTLEQHYLGTTDVDARLEILAQLRDLRNPASVQTFARLFQQAKDEDEKLDLLATLDQMEVSAGKLPIFEAAIYTDQPPEVRVVAIRSLASLGGPEARQLLQTLATHPNSEIREAAAEVLKDLAENPEP